MKNLIHAYGVLASPLQIHQELMRLNVSHSLIDDSLRAKAKLVNMSKMQPAWPVVLPSIAAFKRYKVEYERQIAFVCASKDELAQTNLRVIRDWRKHTSAALQYATVHMFDPGWKLHVAEEGVESFVEKVTTKSFLNDVLDAIYKITPYDLRKEVQAMVIAYLAAKIGLKPLRTKLRSSYKLERLLQLMTSGECHLLRQAVARCVDVDGDADKTAKTYGVAAFDIRYVIKSSAKRAI